VRTLSDKRLYIQPQGPPAVTESGQECVRYAIEPPRGSIRYAKQGTVTVIGLRLGQRHADGSQSPVCPEYAVRSDELNTIYANRELAIYAACDVDQKRGVTVKILWFPTLQGAYNHAVGYVAPLVVQGRTAFTWDSDWDSSFARAGTGTQRDYPPFRLPGSMRPCLWSHGAHTFPSGLTVLDVNFPNGKVVAIPWIGPKLTTDNHNVKAAQARKMTALWWTDRATKMSRQGDTIPDWKGSSGVTSRFILCPLPMAPGYIEGWTMSSVMSDDIDDLIKKTERFLVDFEGARQREYETQDERS
jgi:hypothetical protein